MRINLGRVVPSAIGALDLEVIHGLERNRVTQNIVVTSPDIATEKKPELASVLANIENHLSRTEDMSGIAESDADTIAKRERAIVIESDKLTDGSFRIGGRVEGFHGREPSFGPFLRNERSIIALDLGGILKHDTGKIPGSESTVNIACESLTAKIRQVPAVIDVGMAQNDSVDCVWIKREITIAFDGFAAASLK